MKCTLVWGSGLGFGFSKATSLQQDKGVNAVFAFVLVNALGSEQGELNLTRMSDDDLQSVEGERLWLMAVIDLHFQVQGCTTGLALDFLLKQTRKCSFPFEIKGQGIKDLGRALALDEACRGRGSMGLGQYSKCRNAACGLLGDEVQLQAAIFACRVH
ncbi:hypothetical protein V6N12_066490 [Hibiscus sabdariffa]|uniref:Uncharacterized protein n=1 Tax=Hibiscus sabdariffa TaxID=183260 RepID=A0ABR2CQP9_9ROSI